VIMIRQYAPRKRLARVRRDHSQQIARKIVQALRAVSDVMTMLKTRRRDEKTQMPEVGPMRWRMSRIAASFTPCQSNSARCFSSRCRQRWRGADMD
jgi:predicted nucleic acid binding AN1-type Zn finger protein